MTSRPYATEEGRLMAERLAALLTGSRGKEAADTRRRTAEADRASDTLSIPDPAAVTWTRAQLRERIQRVGAELAPTAQLSDRQTREADPSPYADREPEP
jgi:hypothetical protein